MVTRILVVSDTHGSEASLTRIKEIAQKTSPDVLIHLGDDYKDAQSLANGSAYRLEYIPGTWCAQYHDGMIDNRIWIDLEGWRLFLTHTPQAHFEDMAQDPNPETVLANQQADIFLHGHTHHPIIKNINSVIVINPGHCKPSDRRGSPMSYACLTLTPATVEITIKQLLDDAVLQTATYPKPER